MKRGFRYRLYPTPEQALMMARSCGVARLVYNVSLEQRALAYRVCGRSVGWAEQDAEWVALKKDPEYAWLREVHSDVIGQALRDLETARPGALLRAAGRSAAEGRSACTTPRAR